MSQKLYGLIGKKLAHSFSREYFLKKFQELNLKADYQLFEIEEASMVGEIIQQNPSLSGLNITIPFKSEVIQYLDEISPEVKAIGAVNTIKIQEGKLLGFNTDVYGFGKSLKEWLPEDFRGNALILGTGGAAKAADWVLQQWDQIPEVLFVSRNAKKEGHISYDSLSPSFIQQYPLIINCTPLGMSPQVSSCPPIPYKSLSKSHFLFDMVYNPAVTLFMKNGMENGCMVKNGLEMLHLQAEKAWEIWNGGSE